MDRIADSLSEKVTALNEWQLAKLELFIESLQLGEGRSLVRAASANQRTLV